MTFQQQRATEEMTEGREDESMEDLNMCLILIIPERTRSKDSPEKSVTEANTWRMGTNQEARGDLGIRSSNVTLE